MYRVHIRLATRLGEDALTTAVCARRRRAAKRARAEEAAPSTRARAEEAEEQEDRVIGIGRDLDDCLTSIGQ